jgi:peptidoglycan/LPS O-acetylase OafA/YrhL
MYDFTNDQHDGTHKSTLGFIGSVHWTYLSSLSRPTVSASRRHLISLCKMTRTLESHTSRAGSATPDVQTTASAAKDMRSPALDFTKGTLVLFMVLYHWINYFIGIQWPYYRYLRFLTPSFIFITGFMISNVYLSKYDVGDARLVKRLFTRGLKLIAIFIVLNMFRDYAVASVSPGSVFHDVLDPKLLLATFVTGTFTSKMVVFYVLVPIGYLLMLSGTLILPLRVWRYTFHIACVCLLIIISMLNLSGRNSQTLELIAIGMLGTLAGFSRIAVVNNLVRHPYVLLFLYVLYTMAIATWNVPYPLEIVGTFLTVAAIYLVGTIEGKTNWIRGQLTLLGKYSLFGYISQIVILQVLAGSLRHLDVGRTALVISFAAGFGLTIMAVEVVHRARGRAVSVDRLYRAVFN